MNTDDAPPVPTHVTSRYQINRELLATTVTDEALGRIAAITDDIIPLTETSAGTTRLNLGPILRRQIQQLTQLVHIGLQGGHRADRGITPGPSSTSREGGPRYPA